MYTPKKTFFMARDLEEKNDIGSHITFAERLIYKYKWDCDAKEKFLTLLGEIKEKQRDDKLNLSVVGEFSTGKSTFINAMLRCELLASSAMQGTTVASTIIEYSDEYSIKLCYNNGKEESYSFDSIEALGEKLAYFSTDSDTGKGLDKIVVYIPSENLKGGFRVIDTPGTNALETWHEDVTVKTIRDVSDVSIVLVDATKPLPETLCLFIEDNLGEILDRCVFVVTKIDLVREKERERVLSYVKIKLQQDFDIEEPVVLPYVSTAVLDSIGTDTSEKLYGAELSHESEKRIILHMARQKILNQSKKMTGLIEDMYKSISEQITGILKSFEEELEKLLETRDTSLSSFIEKQKNARITDFDFAAKKYRSEFFNELYKISFYSQNIIVENIDSQTDSDGLKHYIANGLANDCVREAQGILSRAENAYFTVVEWFSNEMKKFQNEFEQNFSNLRTLGIVVPEPRYNIPRAEDCVNKEYLAQMSKAIVQELEKEQGGSWSPRFLGNLALSHRDTHSQVHLAQVKTNAKMRLGESLSEYFNNMVQKAIIALDNYIYQIRICINQEIDRYIVTYKGAVAKRVGEEQSRRMLVERQVENIRMDMSDLERRKTELYSIGEEMTSLMREE